MNSIESAILGLLSWKPMTGYDLKNMIAGSNVLYWSGNNNQIYTSLVKLHQKELVSQEIELRSDSPSRKIYSISQKGRDELRKMLLAEPEPPQLINPFLIQLAWADQLDESELDALLARYEEEMHMQAAMLENQAKQKNIMPSGKTRDAYINPALARSPREAILWSSIQENWISFYQNEYNWVRDLRTSLHHPGERNWK